MKKNILFVIFLFSFIIFTCSESPTIFTDHDISLTVKPEATESWIELHVDGLKTTARYVVKRDTVILYYGALNSPDTVLNDKNLEPLTTYTYSAYARKSGEKSATAQQTISTMDTTSHAIEWTRYEFGDGNNILFDAAIINENDIWAVGEINIAGEENRYNAVHWNGIEWELKRIPFTHPVCGIIPYPRLYAISILNSNNILVSDGGSVVFANGQNYSQDCRPNSMLKGLINRFFYLNSSSVLYAAAGRGSLLSFENNNWITVETNTDLNLYDIYGAWNEENSMQEIYSVAGDEWVSNNNAIFQIRDNDVNTITNKEINYTIHSIWFVPGTRYYIVGDGIFSKHDIHDQTSWKDMQGITDKYLRSIRGTGATDIFACGDFSEIIHYNGNSWYSYTNTYGSSSGILHSIQVTENIVLAVGGSASKAIILIGKR